ncbi:DUF481 domain-containing protein [Rheinheimera riviphila]|uniref:DUF481 domain-containing protein n=1 Tax=Rheinheimera riviphila TaxID=1834037 RepID=UPI0013E362B2|nr:DUF481 domain-containing protein [Rheinheimera riviphila]
MRRLQLISALLLLNLALPASASLSRLHLKNGDVLTGTVQSQSADTVSLLLPYAGLVSIKRDEILQINELAAAELLAEPATASALDVAVIANGSNNKPWSVELDLSASNRHGQQDSSVLNLVVALDYKHQHWRTSLDSHFDYELKDQARKTHQYDVSPGLDYFINPRLFWRGSIDYHYNYLASDYRNLDFSTGPGYAVIQQPKLTLDLVAAVGIKKAYFREDGEVTRFLLFGDQLNYKFSSLEWDLKYQLQHWPIEFYSDGNWMHLLNQPIDFLYFDREVTANLGLRYKLSDKIRLSWSYQYTQTDIELRLPGLENNSLDLKDFRQKLSIGASF